MCCRSRTVAQQCLTLKRPSPSPPPVHGADEMGEGVFLCPKGGLRLVLVALVSASVSFFHAGYRLERTTARCAVETRKRGSETAPFSAAIIGRGKGTSPVLRKKWRAIFQKSTTFVRNTWSFAKNSPVFWGLSTARGRKEPAGLPHSPRVKIAAGALLGFPPPTKSTTPIKPRTRTTFFAKWGRGGRKKDFFPRFGYKMRRLIT